MQKSKKIFKKPKNNHNNHYLIFGIHAVIAALTNIERKKSILYITKKHLPIVEKFNYTKTKIIDKDEFNLLFANKNFVHQEIALEVFPLQYDLESVTDYNQKNSLIIILDQVSDPHNIGAILRTAAAFNATAVINTINNSPNETATIAKTASGGLDIVPYISVTNISKTIEYLKSKDYWIYGFDGQANDLMPKNFPEKICLVFGSEENGIRRLVKENCDLLCKINISSRMESLNVSTAVAIASHATLPPS